MTIEIMLLFQNKIISVQLAKLPPAIKLLNRAKLDSSIISFQADEAKRSIEYRKLLFQTVVLSRYRNDISVAAANAMTILNAANISFSGMNLSGIDIPGAILREGVFDKTNFSGADLSDVDFSHSFLRNAKLGTAMKNANFGESGFTQIGVKYVFFLRERLLTIGEKTAFERRLSDFSKIREINLFSNGDKHNGKIAISTNKNLLALERKNGTIQIYNIDEQSVIKTLRVDQVSESEKTMMSRFTDLKFSPDNEKTMISGFADLKFSPDNKYLISATQFWNCSIHIWDITTGELLYRLEDKKMYHREMGDKSIGDGWCNNEVSCVDISKNSQFIVSGNWAGQVNIWEKSCGRLLNTLEISKSMVIGVAFNEDNKTILAGDHDSFGVWDIHNKKCLHSFNIGLKIERFYKYPNNNLVFVVGQDNNIYLYDLERKKLNGIINNRDPISFLRYCFDSTQLAIVHTKKVRLLDISMLKSERLNQAHSGQVKDFQFLLKNQLVSFGTDHTFRIWDSRNGKQIKRINTDRLDHSMVKASCKHFQLVRSIPIDIIGYHNNAITLYGSEHPPQLLLKTTSRIKDIGFSKNGKYFAFIHERGPLQLCSSLNGEVLHKFTEIIGGYRSSDEYIAFSSDSEFLVFGGEKGDIFFINIKTKKILEHDCRHNSNVNQVLFSHNDQFLVTSAADNTLLIRDRKLNIIHNLHGHNGAVTCLIFSSDDTILVSGGEDHKVIVCNIDNGFKCHILEEHKGQIRSLQLSDNTHFLYSACSNGEIRVWNLNSGECCDLVTDMGCINKIELNQKSGHLFVCSDDNSISCWTLRNKGANLLLKWSTHNTLYISGAKILPDNSKKESELNFFGEDVENKETTSEPILTEKDQDEYDQTQSPFLYRLQNLSSEPSFPPASMWIQMCIFNIEGNRRDFSTHINETTTATLSNWGLSELILQEIDIALQCFLFALEITYYCNSGITQKKKLADILQVLGISYSKYKKSKEINKYFLLANRLYGEIADSINIKYQLIYLFTSIGDTEAENANYKMSKRCYNKVILMAKDYYKTERHPKIAQINEKIGDIYLAQKQFCLAKKYYCKALDIFKQTYLKGADTHSLEEKIRKCQPPETPQLPPWANMSLTLAGMNLKENIMIAQILSLGGPQEREYDAGLAFLKLLIDEYPDNISYKENKVSVLITGSRYEEAILELKSLIDKANPPKIQWIMTLARTYELSHDYESASFWYDKASKTSNCNWVFAYIAHFAFTQNKIDLAVKMAKKVSFKCATDSNTYVEEEDISPLQTLFGIEKNGYLRFIDLESDIVIPNIAEVLNVFGEVLIPPQLIALYILVEANLATEQPDSEYNMKKLQAYVDKNPTSIACYLLGRLLGNSKDAADIAFDKAIALNSHFRDVIYFKLEINESENISISDYIGKRETLDQRIADFLIMIIKKRGYHTQEQQNEMQRGNVLVTRNLLKEALQVYLSAYEMNSSCDEAIKCVATTYEKLNDFKSAIKYYSILLELNISRYGSQNSVLLETLNKLHDLYSKFDDKSNMFICLYHMHNIFTHNYSEKHKQIEQIQLSMFLLISALHSENPTDLEIEKKYNYMKKLLQLESKETSIADKDRLSFLRAAKSGNLSLLKSLFDTNPQILKVISKSNHCTALHFAAGEGRDKCVEWLLQVGIDMSIENRQGKTALDLAKQFQHTAIVARLLLYQVTGSPFPMK